MRALLVLSCCAVLGAACQKPVAAPAAAADPDPDPEEARPYEPGDLEVTHRAPPAYPREYANRPFPEVACTVRVNIDVEGAPSRIEVYGCEDAFAASAAEALARWRWKPVLEDGVAIPVQTQITVRFRRR